MSGRDARRAKAQKRVTALVCRRDSLSGLWPDGPQTVAVVDPDTGAMQIVRKVVVVHE